MELGEPGFQLDPLGLGRLFAGQLAVELDEILNPGGTGQNQSRFLLRWLTHGPILRERLSFSHAAIDNELSLGFPLEVRIGNGRPTFNTPHHAGFVLLDRDEVRDHATVCAGEEWAPWEGL